MEELRLLELALNGAKNELESKLDRIKIVNDKWEMALLEADEDDDLNKIDNKFGKRLQKLKDEKMQIIEEIEYLVSKITPIKLFG